VLYGIGRFFSKTSGHTERLLFATFQDGETQSDPFSARDQGCQMAYFQTRNPDLGKFWRILQWKMLIYLMTIWSIIRQFNLFVVCILMVVWHIFTLLVCCANKNLATLVVTGAFEVRYGFWRRGSNF
jgi:hypothetical protein